MEANPKSEARNPKQIQNPKKKNPKPRGHAAGSEDGSCWMDGGGAARFSGG
jgi:hypothetical protein